MTDFVIPTTLPWTTGLVRLKALSRGQIVEARAGEPVHRIIYRLVHASAGLRFDNLILHRSLRPGEEAFRVPAIFKLSDYACVEIDLAPRTIPFQIQVQAQNFIEGRFEAHISYRVRDAAVILQREDVLTDLRIECQSAAQYQAENFRYDRVSRGLLEQGMMAANTHFLGLHIERVVIPNAIQWPGHLQEVNQDIVTQEDTAYRDDRVNKLKHDTLVQQRQRKLAEFQRMGINNPELLYRAMAETDPDLGAIIRAADEMMERKHHKLLRDEDLLRELIKHDRVDQTELSDFIDSLVSSVISGRKSSGNDEVFHVLPSSQPASSLPDGDITQGYAVVDEPSGPSRRIQQVNRGQSLARAYLVDTVDRRNRVDLIRGKTRIGRKNDGNNDILILDDRVSRHHAVIEERADEFYFINLKSEANTWINGRAIDDEEIRLHDEDEILIGDVRLRFHINNTPHSQTQRNINDDKTRFE